MLSTPDSPTWSQLNGCLPNLLSIFGAGRWNTVADPDQINGASIVLPHIDWTGNIALTSDNSYFDASNSLIFGTVGIESGRPAGSPLASVSSTDYYTSGMQTPLLNAIGMSSGVSVGHDFTDLLAEIAAWKSYIESLPADVTITSTESPNDFTNNVASNGDGGLRTTFTNTNPADDEIIVVDFDIDGDFSVNDVDWVIDAVDSTPVIFRILNGSNMKMENSSILMAEDNFDPEGRFLGGTFYHASDESGSGDTVFTIGNNTILNGIGICDFNAIGEGGSPKTNINTNNGQGCSQFISQAVNFQHGRWARCVHSPTALALGPMGIKSVNGPGTALMHGVGLLLAASAIVVFSRMRRSGSYDSPTRVRPR